MLKKGPAVIGATCLTSALLLSGCGLFQSDKAAEEIDPPQDVTFVNDEAGANSNTTAAKKTESEKSDTAKADQASSTVMRELYLIDKNGYVVAQTLPLPKSESTAKQALEYLVQGGLCLKFFRMASELYCRLTPPLTLTSKKMEPR